MRVFLGTIALMIFSTAASAQGYDTRPEVRAFIDEMVARHGFLESELRSVFAQAQRIDSALQSIQPAERP